ncbi:hypothetical protein [Alteromonas sp. RKMC-009]|uniref:hypothetical protein n=1 Tax=Alteromonas sp. RKMC-009 TaxID=2267264 RepID=UPI000E68519B|nr:hypothetical protein [Alteromonas sp. RKMC-009]AYA64308.1 hypothetical protein DS731_10035 [Alteromonas sp. RKMC-009]
MTILSVDEVKAALPANFKKSINQELIDGINQTISDPEMYEQYRDNLVSYSHVLQNGKFKVTQYLDAVMYVSYKLMGHTNIKSYTLTFPDKIDRFNAQGVSSKDIASYVTAYNKSKLVNLILEQTLVPTWVLNQDLYQKALNVQAELMMTAQSEKVRSDAANSILTQLKQPETQKIQLDVGVKEDSMLEQLKRHTAELVAQQRTLIQSGHSSAQEVAHSKIIQAEYSEVPDE